MSTLTKSIGLPPTAALRNGLADYLEAKQGSDLLAEDAFRAVLHARLPAWEAIFDGLSHGSARPQKGRTGRPAGVAPWYVEYVAECLRQGRTPNRDEDLAAVRAQFGCWTKDSQDVRALRAEHAPEEWKKPGRKSGVE